MQACASEEKNWILVPSWQNSPDDKALEMLTGALLKLANLPCDEDLRNCTDSIKQDFEALARSQ